MGVPIAASAHLLFRIQIFVHHFGTQQPCLKLLPHSSHTMKPRVLEMEIDTHDSMDEEEEEEEVRLLGTRPTSPIRPTSGHVWRRQCLVGFTVSLCIFSLLYLSSVRDSNSSTRVQEKDASTTTIINAPVKERLPTLHPTTTRRTIAPTAMPTSTPTHSPTTISPTSTSGSSWTWPEPEYLSVPYDCPHSFSEALNVATARTDHEQMYETVSSRLVQDFNVSSYMEEFRQVSEYDNWGHTYEEVKAGLYEWKSKMYLDLKDGDSIYESACGIGLNLFMTLEILQEVKGLQNIQVYGSEYVHNSVQIANTIFGNGYLPGNGRLGRICAADSAQLDFVPRRKFDLVFSGYISPLYNPLSLPGTETMQNFDLYNAYCEQNDPRAAEAQRQQERWYGKWVTQMVRLAKPGAPIIIEEVSYP